MPTVQICLASIQQQLPTVTTTISSSSHSIANLYTDHNASGQYIVPKKFTSQEFKNNFFPTGFFSLLRIDEDISTISSWYHSSATFDQVTLAKDPPFNLYNYVLERWDTQIPITSWDSVSQIFIRRDLMNLNNLKNWYLNAASYTWRQLLKIFDSQEDIDGATGRLDTDLDALLTPTTSITQNFTGATDGTYDNLIIGTDGNGSGARLKIVVESGTVKHITVISTGSGYAAGDIITLSKTRLDSLGNTVANIPNMSHELKITLQADDINDSIPINTRQVTNQLQATDHPIISVTYTNANTTLTPIAVNLHFEIIN